MFWPPLYSVPCVLTMSPLSPSHLYLVPFLPVLPSQRFSPLNGFPLSTTNCYSFILIIRPIPFLWQCHCFVPAFVVLSTIRLPILLGSSITFFLQLSIYVRFLHWTLGCALHSHYLTSSLSFDHRRVVIHFPPFSTTYCLSKSRIPLTTSLLHHHLTMPAHLRSLRPSFSL